MAYTFNKYNVMECAGIVDTDTQLEALTKIAEWINESFGDFLEAKVNDALNSGSGDTIFNCVQVCYKGMNCGIGIGYINTGSSASKIHTDFNVVRFRYILDGSSKIHAKRDCATTTWNISGIQFALFKNDTDYMFDFAKEQSTGNDRFFMNYVLNCKDEMGVEKYIWFSYIQNTSSTYYWFNSDGKSSGTYGADFAMSNGWNSSVYKAIILNKFFAVGTSYIPVSARVLAGSPITAHVGFSAEGSNEKYITFGGLNEARIALRVN